MSTAPEKLSCEFNILAQMMSDVADGTVKAEGSEAFASKLDDRLRILNERLTQMKNVVRDVDFKGAIASPASAKEALMQLEDYLHEPWRITVDDEKERVTIRKGGWSLHVAKTPRLMTWVEDTSWTGTSLTTYESAEGVLITREGTDVAIGMSPNRRVFKGKAGAFMVALGTKILTDGRLVVRKRDSEISFANQKITVTAPHARAVDRDEVHRLADAVRWARPKNCQVTVGVALIADDEAPAADDKAPTVDDAAPTADDAEAKACAFGLLKRFKQTLATGDDKAAAEVLSASEPDHETCLALMTALEDCGGTYVRWARTLEELAEAWFIAMSCNENPYTKGIDGCIAAMLKFRAPTVVTSFEKRLAHFVATAKATGAENIANKISEVKPWARELVKMTGIDLQSAETICCQEIKQLENLPTANEELSQEPGQSSGDADSKGAEAVAEAADADAEDMAQLQPLLLEEFKHVLVVGDDDTAAKLLCASKPTAVTLKLMLAALQECGGTYVRWAQTLVQLGRAYCANFKSPASSYTKGIAECIEKMPKFNSLEPSTDIEKKIEALAKIANVSKGGPFDGIVAEDLNIQARTVAFDMKIHQGAADVICQLELARLQKLPNDKESVYVAYVTEGRAEDEYETHFAGTFKSELSAYKALIDVMLKIGVVHSPEEDASVYYRSMCDTASAEGRLMPMEREPTALLMRLKEATTDDEAESAFKSYVKLYGDSFEDDGWNWTLAKSEVRD
jgi:hypothetical protein